MSPNLVVLYAKESIHMNIEMVTSGQIRYTSLWVSLIFSENFRGISKEKQMETSQCQNSLEIKIFTLTEEKCS